MREANGLRIVPASSGRDRNSPDRNLLFSIKDFGKFFHKRHWKKLFQKRHQNMNSIKEIRNKENKYRVIPE